MGAAICDCKTSANEWCMKECESIMVDKGITYMVKTIVKELNPEEHLSVQEQKQNND